MKHVFTCHQCGQEKTHVSDSTTGYALDKEENKICFDCCGINDTKELKELPIGKRLHLYLNTQTKEITNWPGSLRIMVSSIKTSKAKVHNLYIINRYDSWFIFHGNRYHAVQYGD